MSSWSRTLLALQTKLRIVCTKDVARGFVNQIGKDKLKSDDEEVAKASRLGLLTKLNDAGVKQKPDAKDKCAICTYCGHIMNCNSTYWHRVQLACGQLRTLSSVTAVSPCTLVWDTRHPHAELPAHLVGGLCRSQET
mmetsp:Transcript_21086/g.54356  ORF Transcript_21086/g.54356 Transcript_21086/m.54356 type:complete len:137 (-) Transcript_21086:326-736(-)